MTEMDRKTKKQYSVITLPSDGAGAGAGIAVGKLGKISLGNFYLGSPNVVQCWREA